MKSVLIGERYRDKLEKTLNNHGFYPIWLPQNPDIDPRLASHCDLSVFKHGKNIILASYLKNNDDLVNFLTKRGYGIEISEREQDIAYPYDINLCAALIGNKLLHNIKFTDKKILKLGLDQITVKQGYARCTTLIVDECSIISADPGILKAAACNGFDTLMICEHGISLEGFDRGFIGGASFKAGNTIYFTGSLESHPNREEIIDFIIKRGHNICCLSDEPLYDIGGAVVID